MIIVVTVAMMVVMLVAVMLVPVMVMAMPPMAMIIPSHRRAGESQQGKRRQASAKKYRHIIPQ